MAGRPQLESRKGQHSSPPSSSLWEAAQRQLFRQPAAPHPVAPVTQNSTLTLDPSLALSKYLLSGRWNCPLPWPLEGV